MQNKYQRLAGNTVKLGLGTFGSKVLVFLMVRFYTEYLSPADYGRADLITQTANLLIPLLSLGITDAVFRFVIDEAEGAAGIFTTGFFVLLAGIVLAGLLALCGSAELDSAWLIAAFLIASNFHTLPAQFVRAKGEMTCFAVQGLLNTAFVIGLNILFLAVFRLGVTGYVLSTVAADVLTTAYLVLRANTAGVAIRFAGAPVWMLGYIFLSGAVGITAMVLLGDLRLDDPARRGRLSACDPGGQDVPESGLFGVSRPLRAGARRARGHRPFQPCHPRCAPQIPQPDGLVHPRPDGRFALRDRHGPRRARRAAGAGRPADFRCPRLRARHCDPPGAGSAPQMDGAASCAGGPARKARDDMIPDRAENSRNSGPPIREGRRDCQKTMISSFANEPLGKSEGDKESPSRSIKQF